MREIYKNGVSGSQKNIIVRERLTANLPKGKEGFNDIRRFFRVS